LFILGTLSLLLTFEPQHEEQEQALLRRDLSYALLPLRKAHGPGQRISQKPEALAIQVLRVGPIDQRAPLPHIQAPRYVYPRRTSPSDQWPIGLAQALKVVPRHALQDAGDDLELSARLLAVHLPGKAAQSFKRLFGGHFVGPNVHQQHPPGEGADPLLCQVVRELHTTHSFLRVPSVHRLRDDSPLPEELKLAPRDRAALALQVVE
jgi:hypothetical protein